MAAAALPRQLGRYEIEGVLARGGMAELLLARLPGIDGIAKYVAIKRVLPALADDRDLVAMFLEEARLAAQLDHPNIVQVHDIGHDADGYFIAMELLHGEDLGRILRTLGDRRRAMPLPIALEIARAACAGLHHAHERAGADGAPLGVIHRDVSPQNLFVTAAGAVKLLDFGIAKAAERVTEPYTRSGMLRGKLPYMSPEQARGEMLDRRSDVFSLAIVLWEMTVGEPLFGGHANDYDVLKAIVDADAPSPATRDASYPRELERIVMTGLARDRARRYQTAEELLSAIEAFARTEQLWATQRDVAAFLGELFPERVDRWRNGPGLDRVATSPRAANGDRPTVPLQDTPAKAPHAASPPTPAPQLPMPSPAGPAAAVAPRRRTWLVALVAIGIAGALAAGIAIGRSGARDTRAPDGPAAAAPTDAPSTDGAPDAAAAVPVVEDRHWIGPDDYLISDQAYTDGTLDGLVLAKAIEPPRSGARGRFLDARGHERATAYAWRTRIATAGDLAVGRLAFCPGMRVGGTSVHPTSQQWARTTPWIAARVTNAAAGGRVMVGTMDCEVAWTRVPAD